MIRKRHVAALLALVIQGLSVSATAADPSAIRRTIDDFLSRQINGLPGKATYAVGTFDPGRLVDNCSGYDAAMAPGARPWGPTYVLVTCRGGSGTLRVPVKIQVIADYLVTAHALNAGQLIAEGDLLKQSGELSVLPTGILIEKEQAVGRVLAVSLPAGRPLRGDILRQQTVIQQGQSVRLITVGTGFQVSNEGRALGNASIGQVTQVRLNSGQVLSGVARSDGSVEIKL